MTDDQPEDSPKPLGPSDESHERRQDQSAKQVQDSVGTLHDVETGNNLSMSVFRLEFL